jgi:hypothetical protein
MVDASPEDTPPPDLGRAKRAPPTIDLEATEVSGETRQAGAEAPGSGSGAGPESGPEQAPPEPVSREPVAAISAWVIAVVSGAVAASLVIAVAWVLGWPAVPATPQTNAAVIDDLAARVTGLEAKAAKPASDPAPAPDRDPGAAARLEALEKSLTTLRAELTGLRTQSGKLAAAIDDVKLAPHEGASPPDLSAINERIAQLEHSAPAQGAEAAGNAKPADDMPLRRIVAAALLDVLVRTGDPYPTALSAAKSLTDNAEALKPLEGFAASGVPSAAALGRELLTLVPKLSPPAPENSSAGAGLVDRLQASAAKLVRIERTDAVGNEPGNVVARVTAAALRNDLTEARRELNTLAPADRAAAQAWLDKADARDAALAASRKFAADAMAALAKPAQ